MNFPKIIKFALLVTALIYTGVLSPLLISPVCAESVQMIDKIVAVVNDEIVTQSDIDRILAVIEAELRSEYDFTDNAKVDRKIAEKLIEQKLAKARETIIQQMVDEKLVLSEAKKYEIKIDQDKIDARLDAIRERFGSEEQMEQALYAESLTLKDLRDRFVNQEIMKKAVDYFVRSKVRIDPVEINLYFKTHESEFFQPEKVKVRSIFIRIDEDQNQKEALRKAVAALKRLRKGEKFEDLVQEYSQGLSAGEGGSLGYIERGQLIPKIDEVLFDAPLGKFTKIFKTEQGYYIFKVEEKHPRESLSFLDVQDKIGDMLYNKEFNEIFKKWIEELREKAYISIK